MQVSHTPTAILCVLSLAACSTSGVTKLGPDTYGIGTANDVSAAAARQQAVSQAEGYCTDRGLIMVPVDSSSSADPQGLVQKYAQYNLVFRCSEAGSLGTEVGSGSEAAALEDLSNQEVKEKEFWKKQDTMDDDCDPNLKDNCDPKAF